MAKNLTDAEKAERAKKLAKAALKKRRARADTNQSSDFDTVISDVYGTPEEKEKTQQERTERLDKLKKEREAQQKSNKEKIQARITARAAKETARQEKVDAQTKQRAIQKAKRAKPENVKRRIRKNIKNCTKQFLESIGDPELKELLGEGYTAYLDNYAKTAVNKMAKSAFDQLKKDPNLGEAGTEVIKQYMSDHYRLFREVKEKTIGQFVANNNLSAYIKSTANNFAALVSGFFANHFYMPVQGVQASVGRFIQQLEHELIGSYAEDLALIARQENTDLTDVVALTTGGQQTVKVVDSLMKGAEGDGIHDKVARAYKKFTTNIKQLRERHGIPTGDIGDDFITRITYDAHKLVDIPDDIWKEYSTKNKADLTPLELHKESANVWALYNVERIDWDKSFPNVYTPDLKSKLDTLHGAYNNIISEIKHARPENRKYTGLLNRIVGGQRQIFAINGKAWLELRAFGEEDLNKAAQSMAHNTARYVSLVNKFGPDPEEGMAFVERTYRQLHPPGPETDKNIRTLYSWFDYYANTSKIDPDMRTELATKLLAAIPNLFWLGKAAIKSMGDVYTLWAVKKQMRLPNALSSSLAVIPQYFSKAARLDHEAVRKALGHIDIGYTLATNEVLSRNLIKAGDYSGYTDRALSWLNKVGGLTLWDSLVQLSMRTSVSSQLADSVQYTFDKISHEMRLLLTHAGVTAKQWNVIRTSQFLVKEINGHKLFVPFEAAKISDKMASEASGIDIKQKSQLKIFKNSIALRMNSAVKSSSEAVVPTFNPVLDKEYITQKKAFLENGHNAIFGVNYQYMFYNLLNQYKSWAINYQEVVLRRAWQTNSPLKTRLMHVAQLAGGLTITNAILDSVYGTITANESDKRTTWYENLMRNAVNTSAGRFANVIMAFEAAFTGHGPEVNRTPSLDKLARIFREFSHIVSPKQHQTHSGALWELTKDAAPTVPIQVMLAFLQILTNGGE